MREVAIDEAGFASAAEVHAYLADKLEFPKYYGGNLDALADCLEDLSDEVGITVYLAQYAYDLEADDADPGELYEWFPRLCRTLLRSSLKNPCIKVLVHLEGLSAYERILACPKLPELLDEESFVVRGMIAHFSEE